MLLYTFAAFLCLVQATLAGPVGVNVYPKDVIQCRPNSPISPPLVPSDCASVVERFYAPLEWRGSPQVWYPASPAHVQSPFSQLHWSYREKECALTVIAERMAHKDPKVRQMGPIWRPTEHEWARIGAQVRNAAELLIDHCTTRDPNQQDSGPGGYGGRTHFEVEKQLGDYGPDIYHPPGAPPPVFEFWVDLHDARERVRGLVAQRFGEQGL